MRVITRLDETCREVRDAARVIGDAELFKKMEEAQVKIKRDSECTLVARPTCRLTFASSCICGKLVFLVLIDDLQHAYTQPPGITPALHLGISDKKATGTHLETHQICFQKRAQNRQNKYDRNTRTWQD